MNRFVFPVVATALLASGCMTAEMQNRDLAVSTELSNLRANVERLQERYSVIEQQQARLQADLETVRRETANGRQGDRAAVDSLAQRIELLNRAREQDRAAMVDDLSKRMAAIMAQSRASAPAPTRSSSGGGGSSGSGKPQAGYEHEVKPGQTLSEISKAYGVKVETILRANNMQNDRLRVGQKLFIPE